jgi:hypothetical protein
MLVREVEARLYIYCLVGRGVQCKTVFHIDLSTFSPSVNYGANYLYCIQHSKQFIMEV